MIPKIVTEIRSALLPFKEWLHPYPWESWFCSSSLNGKEGFLYTEGDFIPFHNRQKYTLGSSVAISEPDPAVIANQLGLTQDPENKMLWYRAIA